MVSLSLDNIKNRIKHFFKIKQFRFQIFLVMLLISVLTISIISTAFLSISRNVIEENYQKTHNSYMELFSSTIDLRIENIIKEIRDLLENNEFLEMIGEEGREGPYFSTRVQQKIDDTFFKIESGDQYISGLLIINMEGKFRYVRKSGTETSNKVSEYYKSGNILENDWISLANEADGKEVVIGHNVLDDSDDILFSIVKLVNNPKTLKPVGYMVVSVSKDIIRHVLGRHSNILKEDKYFILDNMSLNNREHFIVYSNNIEENEEEEVLNEYKSGKNDNYVFGRYISSTSGWEIVSAMDRNKLSRQSEYIEVITLIAIVVAIIASILVSIGISRNLNKPLMQLEETISEVGRGNYEPDVIFDDSEIGQVGKHFLEMAGNNLQLRERVLQAEINEKQAQFLLLQSQINPHFLYNTLDALYFMAVIDEALDAAEMIKALSDMFRLSLNKGDKLISVSDELKRVEAYMKIQNMRYLNRFDLAIDVSSSIMSERVLTFLIQPIVENAVVHGLENKIGKGTVSIVGYRDEDILKFTIHDNGIGIEDMEALEKGYGIRNIRERIGLFYGEKGNVSFESTVGEGTTVFFELPIVRGELLENFSDN